MIFFVAILLFIFMYSTMCLGFYSFILAKDEVNDDAAFINIGENLCSDEKQEYAKMEHW